MRLSTAILMVASILMSACQEQDKLTVKAFTGSQTLPLQVVKVKQQDVPRYYSATGYTHISRSIEISSSQTGTITKIQVDEGDVVKAGALLIVIDESELLTTIEQAKSAVQTATINIKDRKQDLEKANRLRLSNMIADETRRKAQVQLDLAWSQLNQANSELQRQQTRKPYFRLTSPIDARVVKKWVAQGDQAQAGKPLIKLEAVKGLEFVTALPAKWIDTIQPGDIQELRLHDSGKVYPATISHIIRSANRVTQTCQIKLLIPDSSELSAGLSGQVDFKINHQKQLLIPESSVIKRAGVSGVFRVNNSGEAQFTAVKTETNWQQQWVVLSGLKAGETMLLNPPDNIRDGDRIRAKNSIL